jgi:cysteine desulfurase
MFHFAGLDNTTSMNKLSPIYFDHAATTTTSPEVLDSMLPYFSARYGNPSSLHSDGRLARYAIDSARESISSVLRASPEEIIFTASGTESNNLAVLGVARAHKKHGNHILVSAIEHKSVLAAAKQLTKEGFDVEYIPVDEKGMIDVVDCISRVREKTILISVMYANNEIGTVEPIQKLAEELQLHKKGNLLPIFHTDACQAAGYMPLNVTELGVDLLTLNSSKIYGPKGVGLLYRNKKVTLAPVFFGGGQEYGLRPGTENLPSIVGFKEALLRVEKRRVEESERLCSLRDECLRSLSQEIPSLVINGHPLQRLPNNIHISIPEIEGESMVLMLDNFGIHVATGSACSAHDLQVSHVLTAIKQDSILAHGSLRITFGEETTKAECDYLVKVLPEVIVKLRRMSPLPLLLPQLVSL